MRKSIIFAAAAALLTFSSCEKDLEVYSDPTCRLNFYYSNISSTANMQESLSKATYSFVYSGETVTRDTLWYEVESMGFLSDKDRPISLEQVDTAATMAVPGKHYVAFDDPSLASLYVMPAGKARTRIPVVLLRDASLKDESVVLKFRIKPNEYFQSGYDVFQTRTLTFSDRMSEPANWTKQYPYPGFSGYYITVADYFGTYGQQKHLFLIEHTGKQWDDDYIEQLMTGDLSYVTYLCQKMQQELDELNAERAAQGLDALAEEDGTPVVIYTPYQY